MTRNPLLPTTSSHLHRHRLVPPSELGLAHDMPLLGTRASAERRTGVVQLPQQPGSRLQMTSRMREEIDRRPSTAFVVHISSNLSRKMATDCCIRMTSHRPVLRHNNVIIIVVIFYPRHRGSRGVWKK